MKIVFVNNFYVVKTYNASRLNLPDNNFLCYNWQLFNDKQNQKLKKALKLI